MKYLRFAAIQRNSQVCACTCVLVYVCIVVAPECVLRVCLDLICVASSWPVMTWPMRRLRIWKQRSVTSRSRASPTTTRFHPRTCASSSTRSRPRSVLMRIATSSEWPTGVCIARLHALTSSCLLHAYCIHFYVGGANSCNEPRSTVVLLRQCMLQSAQLGSAVTLDTGMLEDERFLLEAKRIEEESERTPETKELAPAGAPIHVSACIHARMCTRMHTSTSISTCMLYYGSLFFYSTLRLHPQLQMRYPFL